MIASKFAVDNAKGYAEADIPMYRFADYNVVNIQCDILICRGIVFLLSLFDVFFGIFWFGLVLFCFAVEKCTKSRRQLLSMKPKKNPKA